MGHSCNLAADAIPALCTYYAVLGCGVGIVIGFALSRGRRESR